MMIKGILGGLAAIGIGLGLGGAAEAGPTLDKVKQGGLVCGVPTGIPGFGMPDSQGKYSGLDIDVCKAIAAAVLGDPEKVKYVPLTAVQRFPALQSGEVDILSNNTTWTLLRDTELGFNFGPVVFYDGQGFMVPKKLGVKSAKELNGATICVAPGTTSELNLADYFRATKMDFKPVVIEKVDEIYAAFFSGRCDVISGDAEHALDGGILALRHFVDISLGDAFFLGLEQRIDDPVDDVVPLLVAMAHHGGERLLGDALGQDNVIVGFARPARPLRGQSRGVTGNDIATA